MPSRRTDYVRVEEEGAKGENERCGAMWRQQSSVTSD